jgi:Tfp pilus assembly protein PilX
VREIPTGSSPVNRSARKRKLPEERGVVLVITLVMLSVVTFMAITFLAVSRRERAAVSVVEEQSRA